MSETVQWEKAPEQAEDGLLEFQGGFLRCEVVTTWIIWKTGK